MFAKFCGFRAVLGEKLQWRRRKYCKQKSIKFGGNVAFFYYDLAHSFAMNAKQDNLMFILTLMLYCTSKSCKIQVAKVATKQQF